MGKMSQSVWNVLQIRLRIYTLRGPENVVKFISVRPKTQ